MRSAMPLFYVLILIATTGRTSADEEITLSASGSSFINPLMQKLALEFHKLHPDVKINYTSTGSGTGIKQISDQTMDFGASDVPMTAAQLKATTGGELLHIPLTMGAVVPIYKIPGLAAKQPLVFSGPILANIFRGKITSWNDPAIAKLNPGVNFPNANITVVVRADRSGTTLVFTDFLSSVSADFAKSPGKGMQVNWPANPIAARGCEGISGIVQKNPGAIGYVEMIFANANNLPFGDVINSSGKTIHASLESVSAAANQEKLTADLRLSAVDAPDESAYPISTFAYLLVYKKQSDAKKGKALIEFLKWSITDGQKLAPDLFYAPIPDNIVKANLKLIDSMTLP